MTVPAGAVTDNTPAIGEHKFHCMYEYNENNDDNTNDESNIMMIMMMIILIFKNLQKVYLGKSIGTIFLVIKFNSIHYTLTFLGRLFVMAGVSVVMRVGSVPAIPPIRMMNDPSLYAVIVKCNEFVTVIGVK